MNIKFCYLYRDASNYKQFNEIVFANQNQIPLDRIQAIIRSKLIEECWFVAKDWNLRDLHFKEYSWNNDLDHEWHEFDSKEESMEAKTTNTSIEAFIDQINKEAHPFTPEQIASLICPH